MNTITPFFLILPSGFFPFSSAMLPGLMPSQWGLLIFRIHQRFNMTAMPPSNQPAPAQPAAAPAKKSSSGCMKGCLGCGCITVIGLLLLLLAGGGYVYSQGPALKEGLTESFTAFAETSGSMDFSAGGAAPGQAPSLHNLPAQTGAGGAADATGQPSRSASQNRQLQNADRFFEIIDRPLTERDIKNVQSGLESWGQTRTITRFNKLLEDGERLKDSDSVMDNVRALRVIVGIGFRIRDISEEFPAHVERHGGDEFLHDYTQLLAIHRVSQVAAARQQEPWDQAVADALLKDHDENREAFDQTRAMLQEAANNEALDISELPHEEQTALYEAFSNQFLLMTSAINRRSLQSWAALSDEERKALSEEFNKPHNYLSRTFGMLRSDDAQELIYLHFLGL